MDEDGNISEAGDAYASHHAFLGQSEWAENDVAASKHHLQPQFRSATDSCSARNTVNTRKLLE